MDEDTSVSGALASLAARLEAVEAERTPANTFPARIKLPYGPAQPYNELQWIDEAGAIRGQIVAHGWDSQTPPQFHGHLSFYVWDATDPSGNNRHHPMNIYWGVRDPADSPSEPRHRSRIAFDHAYVDLMDSRLVMRSADGQPWEIVVSDQGQLSTRKAIGLPAPTE